METHLNITLLQENQCEEFLHSLTAILTYDLRLSCLVALLALVKPDSDCILRDYTS